MKSCQIYSSTLNKKAITNVHHEFYEKSVSEQKLVEMSLDDKVRIVNIGIDDGNPSVLEVIQIISKDDSSSEEILNFINRNVECFCEYEIGLLLIGLVGILNENIIQTYGYDKNLASEKSKKTIELILKLYPLINKNFKSFFDKNVEFLKAVESKKVDSENIKNIRTLYQHEILVVFYQATAVPCQNTIRQ